MSMREIDGDEAEAPKGKRNASEDRRVIALHAALQGSYANINEQSVINRAKVFEAYLKDGN